MGVTHVLMVALMGITYGWQSDDNGDVEYIVQVSPDELKQIDRLGEISSVIDPAVAGHVSRITIRVGSARLPRQTPPALVRAPRHPKSATPTQTVTTSDRSAIPIPEMQDRDRAIPIRSSNVTAMMKPDPDNGSAAPGLQLPPFPGPASGPTQGFANEIDGASRSTTGFSNNGIDPLANPNPNPFNNPGTRTNGGGQVSDPSRAAASPSRQPSLPPFAVGNQTNNGASTFAGGPSTEPAKTRDQSWKDWAGPRPNGPSTAEVGSDRRQFTDPRTEIRSAINAPSTPFGSSNGRTGGTFGQTPAGMTFPNGPNSNQSFSQDRVLSQQQQMELDRRTRASQNVVFGRQNNQKSLFDRQRETFVPNTKVANTRDANDQRSGNNVGFPNKPKVSNQLNPNRQFATEPPKATDRRLTQAELAAGARSFDRYGNLVDQNGRRISMAPLNSQQPDRRASIYPQPGIDNRYDYAQSRARLEQPTPSRNDGNLDLRQREPIQYERNRVPDPRDRRYQPTLAAQNGNRVGSTRTPFERDPRTSSKDPRSEFDREPESQSDRISNAGGTSRLSEIPRTARNHVAAQPLFNGLLLMSFVANIYLMFWLKNLRIRFRDMVAAKRVAGPDTQPA